jgi:hypothetical protein
MWKSGRNGPYRRRRAGETARHPSVMPPIWPATRAISWLLPVARTAAATRKAREYEELTKACQRTVSPVLGALVAGTLSADNVQMQAECRWSAANAASAAGRQTPRLLLKSSLSPLPHDQNVHSMFFLESAQARRDEGVFDRAQARRMAANPASRPCLTGKEQEF